MHHCLWIQDVIARIIEEIAEYEHGHLKPSSRSALVNLAQTCRTLSEPSLNSLWRVQTSLVPLLNTMPADLWVDRDDQLVSYFARDFEYPWVLTTEHPIQSLRRPIKPADWGRFHIYACRIYYFLEPSGFFEPHRRTLPFQCLQALSCSKPRDMISLCPQVRSLNWESLVTFNRSDSPSSYQYMPLFMGAFTTKVLFSINKLKHAELPFAQSMLRLFPSIRDITFREASTYLDAEALSECLSHGQLLQAVRIDGVLPQAVAEHLAGFQHLKRLDVGVNQHFSSPRLSGFCALEELAVTSSKFPFISTFINMLNSPLRNITLSMYHERITAEIYAHGLAHTFNAIGLHCSHLHLQSLKIYADYLSSTQCFVDAAAFEPLLAFQNLSSLKLILDAPFRMGNQTIREMVAAWPQLTSLIIGTGGWLGGSSITPAGLVHLLRLPNLQTLAISIDASKVDVDLASDSAKTLPKNIKIRYFDLQDSIIHDVVSMIALLSVVTPNIESIQSWEDDMVAPGMSYELTREYHSRWSEVAGGVVNARFSEQSVCVG